MNAYGHLSYTLSKITKTKYVATKGDMENKKVRRVLDSSRQGNMVDSNVFANIPYIPSAPDRR